MQLSVVIPMYNEVDNAASLLHEVGAALRGRFAYEIVVVDDGSSDGTGERLMELKRDIAELRVVRHRRNFGQSAGIFSGIRAATAPLVATLDGDGQNNPADIPALYEEAQRQAGSGASVLVAGNRHKRNDNWLRRLSSRVANGVRQGLLQDDCMDTGCGLKVFPRQTFLELPHFDHFHRFLPALFKRAGGRIVNVPVGHRPRAHGQSKYGIWNRLWVGIIDLMGVRWLQRRPCRPEWEYESE
ncbi:MAG: glycosyltransferase family 2 protein [Gammaproteobacteria bacterium]